MELHIKPGTTMSWKDFTLLAEPHSIALDGFVPEGPRLNPSGPWANFNHHEEVSRLETRATCAQVLVALRMGLFEKFKQDLMEVYVNDCDEDVCLSVFLLQNPGFATRERAFRLNRLVFMEDMLDTTGGAYAFADSPSTLGKLLWVFQPYHVFRATGELYHQNADAYRAVIEEVGVRIRAHILGKLNSVEPDMRFETVSVYNDLVMVREIGANARLGVFGSGLRHFISVRELPNGRHMYSVARSSQFVPFPIPKLLKVLNSAELRARLVANVPVLGNTGGWGGSDMIAGSPRDGSVISPDSVMRIIHESKHDA